MVLSQVIVAVGLAGMAIVKPEGGLMVFGALALLAAFASATQDIVIDAWRIEIADNTEELGLLTSGTQIGYRSALLVTDALILILATYVGWAPSYWVMAALMGVGLMAALFMARTVTILEVATHTAGTPAEVLAEASRRLVEGNETCMFATVLCGHIDVRSGRCTLANAGQFQAAMAVTRIETREGEVLADFAAPPNGIYGVFPQRKHMPRRGRLWIEYLKQQYAQPAFWQGR